jgi:hypothetical protein
MGSLPMTSDFLPANPIISNAPQKSPPLLECGPTSENPRIYQIIIEKDD